MVLKDDHFGFGNPIMQLFGLREITPVRFEVMYLKKKQNNRFGESDQSETNTFHSSLR